MNLLDDMNYVYDNIVKPTTDSFVINISHNKLQIKNIYNQPFTIVTTDTKYDSLISLMKPLVQCNYSHGMKRWNIFPSHASSIINRVLDEQINIVVQFLRDNLKMNNPRQSKVYRFFNRVTAGKLNFNAKIRDVFYSIYRYIYEYNCHGVDNSQKHTDNIMLLLKEFSQKYNNLIR
jgi:hypothetical protein